MSIRINYYLNKLRNLETVGALNNKGSLFIVMFFSVILVSTSLSLNFGSASAQLNLDDFMKQTQDNIQSTIEKSNNDNNNNNNNCNNNVSIQSQTNDNGKTTSTTRNTCDDKTTTSTSSTNGQSSGLPAKLNGTISSSEIDQNNGTIINSLYGNWSLNSRDNGSKDFNASIVNLPYSYNASVDASNNDTTANSGIILSDNQTSDLRLTNITSYQLSNFLVNSVQQQNNDVTYSGRINVVQEIRSNNATVSNETNNFNGVNISVTLIDNRILLVNFDSQSPLYKEFENIPIVGLVK